MSHGPLETYDAGTGCVGKLLGRRVGERVVVQQHVIVRGQHQVVGWLFHIQQCGFGILRVGWDHVEPGPLDGPGFAELL